MDNRIDMECIPNGTNRETSSGVTEYKLKGALEKVCLIVTLVLAVTLAAIGVYLSIAAKRNGKLSEERNQDTNGFYQVVSTQQPSDVTYFEPVMKYIRLNPKAFVGVSYREPLPTLMFDEPGVYNITLSVAYDENHCRRDMPSTGNIHLALERAEDHSRIGKVYRERHRSVKGRKWMIYVSISTNVTRERGQGLRISTDFPDCIRGDMTYFSVAKLR